LQSLALTLKKAGIKYVGVNNILPRVTGGPAVASQTVITNFQTGGTLRAALNTALPGYVGNSQIDAVIDMSSIVCDSVSLDKWAVGNWGDGVHPDTAACILMAAAFNTAASSFVAA
jgi:hypothetical protein